MFLPTLQTSATSLKVDSVHSRYHNNYNTEDLMYIIYGAAYYLKTNGFTLNNTDLNPDPYDENGMLTLISLALAEHRTGSNSTDGYARNKRGARNANGTYDHGLWQINLNWSNLNYLTSSQGKDGVNSNIPAFKGKSKNEIKEMMYNPYYNAMAAIALSQLTVGPIEAQGINNWSTSSLIGEDSAYYQEAKSSLDRHHTVEAFSTERLEARMLEGLDIPNYYYYPDAADNAYKLEDVPKEPTTTSTLTNANEFEQLIQSGVNKVMAASNKIEEVTKPYFGFLSQLGNNFMDSMENLRGPRE